MGGFENEGSYVSMLHDHVARSISNLVGEPGSVPENPKARTDYEYTYTLTLPDNLQHKENIEIIVMLISEVTGEIENADVKKFSEVQAEGTTAIQQITSSTDASTYYYDIHGRAYQSKPTTKGIYIYKGEKIVVQ